MKGATTGLRLALVAGVATLTFTGAALAQVGTGGGDIAVSADTGDFFRAEGRGVYTGNVNVTQGKARLKADKITLICVKPTAAAAATANDGACDELEKVIAEGNVYYITEAEKVRGDRGEYNYANDTIIVTGDVILSRGTEGVMQGRRLIYSVAEGRARMAGEEGQKGGVFGVFQRKSGGQPSTTPSPTP